MTAKPVIPTILFTISPILFPLSALAQQSETYRYGPHMMGWGAGWYGMVLGPLMMIAMLAIVIAVAVLLVRWIGGPWTPNHASPQADPGPVDILKQRFARGEIDKKEFEERRRILEQ